jgi:hypothetical protein
MIRRTIFLAAFLATAGASSAQDFGSLLDPTTGLVLFELESSPDGGDIEFRGLPEGLTNQKLWLDPRYLTTLRIVLEGYLPCTYEQGIKVKRKIGKTGVGVAFTCRLQGDPSKLAGSTSDGPPDGWEVIIEEPLQRN